MYIKEIILEGFKSYATRTVISAWDPQFNAITGLNGSGKSNILDAICFVLGIDNLKQVRATSLQDLIYKRGQSGIAKASVTLVFDNTDPQQSPIGYTTCPELTVTRQVMVGGKNKYLVNGHVATNRVVENLFQSVQLNVNNPHFLIMQGQITKVLNMKPPEIMALLEEAAGTRMFEDRRAKALSTIDKKDRKVGEIEGLLGEVIQPKLAALRAERTQFMEYKRGEAEADRLKRLLLAFQFYTHSQSVGEKREMLIGLQGSAQEFAAEEQADRQQLREIDSQLAELKKRREAEQGALSAAVKSLNDSLHTATISATRTVTQLEILSTQQGQLQEDLKKLRKSSNTQQSSNQTRQKKLASLKDKLEEHRQAHERLSAQVSESEELLQGLETGVSLAEDGSAETGYTRLISSLRARQSESNRLLQESQLRLQAVEEELSQVQSQLKSSANQSSDLPARIQSLQERITSAKANTATTSTDFSQTKWSQLESSIAKERATLDQLHSRLGYLSFRYSDPRPNFDRSQVRGVVAQLIKISDAEMAAKYGQALEVTAGGRLYNVVVDTEAVAGDLLENGKLTKRVTIIPLDRIQPRLIPADKLSRAGQIKGVQSALQLVAPTQEDLNAAIQYVFGGTFVCDDDAGAERVAFDAQIGCRAVTLQGDVYEPSGTLTGGSKGGNGNSSGILEQLHALQASQQRYEELMAERAQLEKYRAAAEASQAALQSISLMEHELSLLQRQFSQNAHGRLVGKIEVLTAERSALQETISSASQSLQEIRSQIAKADEEAQSFAQNREGRLKALQRDLKAAKSKLIGEAERLKGVEAEYAALEGEVQASLDSCQRIDGEIASKEVEISTLVAQISELQSQKQEQEELVKRLEAQLEAEQQQLLRFDAQASQLTDQRATLTDKIEKLALLQKKLQGDVERLTADISKEESTLDSLLKEAPWIGDCYEQFGIGEFSFDGIGEAQERLKQLMSALATQRRSINSNVMDMIDRVEAKDQGLRQMLTTIHHDKSKIAATIDTLDDFKREALQRTIDQVNSDFGAILADLLPGAFCRLDPLEGEGLEIRVQLGGVWKESLTELSGGQRSLTALALILALLRFRPAPMYILDEVDAALDLSHTQNIGSLLKRRFKGSQFIVVSLKEGMFTNANVLFRTKFRDGVSSVERHVQNEGNAPKKTNNNKRAKDDNENAILN